MNLVIEFDLVFLLFGRGGGNSGAEGASARGKKEGAEERVPLQRESEGNRLEAFTVSRST